jgi:5-methyltetrahydrofolate--homocysteine methyltransferase
MDSFLQRLDRGENLVADGATGTNLQRVGLAPGTHTEDWVLDEPEKILDLENAFVHAGADIILTCTFGATGLRMKGGKYAESVAEINRRAAELARQAASNGSNVVVGGSMGPLGQLLKPYGPVTAEEASAAFAEQARGLSEGSVDVLVIETQYSLEEADAAFKGARSVTNLPVVVSFSYDRGSRTMMGVRATDVINRYRSMGVAMIGANCGTTLENMKSILGEYAAAAPGFPLWAKPNAGLPRADGTSTVYDVTSGDMAEFAREAIRLGARVVGGCCGTTPQHIAAMALELRAIAAKRRAEADQGTGAPDSDV